MSYAESSELLDQARQICRQGDGRAARVSALLARQALELTLELYWIQRGFPAVAETSMRAQLLCLGEFLGREEVAEQTSHTWWALSRACHHHPYELSPLQTEISAWVEQVEATARVLQTLAAEGHRSQSVSRQPPGVEE